MPAAPRRNRRRAALIERPYRGARPYRRRGAAAHHTQLSRNPSLLNLAVPSPTKMPPAAKLPGGGKQELGCDANAGLRALCRCHAFPHLIDKGGRLHQAVTGQTKREVVESQVAVFDPLAQEVGQRVL